MIQTLPLWRWTVPPPLWEWRPLLSQWERRLEVLLLAWLFRGALWGQPLHRLLPKRRHLHGLAAGYVCAFKNSLLHDSFGRFTCLTCFWVAARRIIHMNVYAAGFFMFFVYQFWFKPLLDGTQTHLSSFKAMQLPLFKSDSAALQKPVEQFYHWCGSERSLQPSCEGLLWGALLRCQQWNWSRMYRPVK